MSSLIATAMNRLTKHSNGARRLIEEALAVGWGDKKGETPALAPEGPCWRGDCHGPARGGYARRGLSLDGCWISQG